MILKYCRSAVGRRVVEVFFSSDFNDQNPIRSYPPGDVTGVEGSGVFSNDAGKRHDGVTSRERKEHGGTPSVWGEGGDVTLSSLDDRINDRR